MCPHYRKNILTNQANREVTFTFCTIYRDDASGCKGEDHSCPFIDNIVIKEPEPTEAELKIANTYLG